MILMMTHCKLLANVDGHLDHAEDDVKNYEDENFTHEHQDSDIEKHQEMEQDANSNHAHLAD